MPYFFSARELETLESSFIWRWTPASSTAVRTSICCDVGRHRIELALFITTGPVFKAAGVSEGLSAPVELGCPPSAPLFSWLVDRAGLVGAVKSSVKASAGCGHRAQQLKRRVIWAGFGVVRILRPFAIGRSWLDQAGGCWSKVAPSRSPRSRAPSGSSLSRSCADPSPIGPSMTTAPAASGLEQEGQIENVWARGEPGEEGVAGQADVELGRRAPR